MSNEVQAEEVTPIVLTESDRTFGNQVLKDVGSSFDLATTVMSIASQISLPKKNPAVKVTSADIVQFMTLARSMHLDPVLGGIYGFKSPDGRLTLGVSKKGWQQALDSQPSYAGNTYIRPKMEERRVSDKNGTVRLLMFPYVTCKIRKILPNGQIGEFEGTAYFDEEFDSNKPTWMLKPKRMLESRALTIAASNAYGWGAYEPDEISNIPNQAGFGGIVGNAVLVQGSTAGAQETPQALTEKVSVEQSLLNDINSASSYDEIIKIFKSAPAELQKNKTVIDACAKAKADLQLGE